MSIAVAPIKAAVTSAFTAFAEPFILRNITSAGTFDDMTGTVTGRTYTDRTVQAIDSGRERKFVNGSMVVEDQYVIYVLDDGGSPPVMTDIVVMDGKEIAIQSVDEYQLVGTKLAYRVAIDK
jgi:hypothetical protein